MERVAVKLGAFFRMKKMNFSKIEDVDTERIDDLIDTYKINEIKNPDMKRLFNIDKNLKNIWTEMKARAEDENREIKWKYAAIVMDRLFFFLTIIYSLVTFCSTVLSIPNLYRFT
jgi:hypothetical protein